jgi:uncharacterized membrane protein YgcG
MLFCILIFAYHIIVDVFIILGMNKTNFFFPLFLFFFFFRCAYSAEKIILFHSDITISQDATAIIIETITVESHGQKIIRGIVRELPERYEILSVLKEGNETSYKLEYIRGDGEHILIGNDTKLETGNHIYQITYKMQNVVDFYQNHDEFYYNVTGNDWRLSIEKAEAVVHLPKTISAASIAAEAYMGVYGAKEENYETKQQENIIYFSTTNKLESLEGLSIVISWEKGKIYQAFFHEHPLFFWLFICGIIFLISIGLAIIQRYRFNKPGLITPLFYPPENLSPSVLGLVNNLAFSSKLIAADIVQLAVEGYITISDKPSFLWWRTYTLSLLHSKTDDVYKTSLLSVLFSKSNNISLTRSEHRTMRLLREMIFNHCKNKTKTYVKKLPIAHFFIIYSAIFSIALIFVYYHNKHYIIAPYAIPLFIFFLIWAVIIKQLLYSYTAEGRKLQDQIDGFKLFLTMTEPNLSQLTQQLPEKTKDLYERYLPYALALGVSQQWTDRFTSLSGEKIIENTFKPLWYSGPTRFYVRSFSSSFSSSIQSSSGRGGRGSSGGGRGGGGGGGR